MIFCLLLENPVFQNYQKRYEGHRAILAASWTEVPWLVRRVDLSLADQRVVVEVVLKKGQLWADPTDVTKRAHINGWSERQWRHLDTCQFETVIKARIPQLKYSDGILNMCGISPTVLKPTESKRGSRHNLNSVPADRSIQVVRR